MDLPIQREKHTNYPMVQATGVKGAFRDWAGQLVKKRGLADSIKVVFGPKPTDEDTGEHGGSLAFTDAQILLFPVRSFIGSFAWITCPAVLNRLRRNMNRIGQPDSELDTELYPLQGNAMVTDQKALATYNGKVILEDITFGIDITKLKAMQGIAEWIGRTALPQTNGFEFIREQLKKRLIVLHDERFKDFVSLSTEVITRIRIGESGTVESGALWTQELLPTDSLLYSLALAKDNQAASFYAADSMKYLAAIINKSGGGILQMGGDETLGKGLVRVVDGKNGRCKNDGNK